MTHGTYPERCRCGGVPALHTVTAHGYLTLCSVCAEASGFAFHLRALQSADQTTYTGEWRRRV